MISPIVGASYETIVSYSNTFKMPFVHPGYSYRTRSHNHSFTLSMKPQYLPAVLEVMKHYKWESVIYLYDNDDGLIKLQHLFGLLDDETFSFQLKAVKHIKSAEEGYQFLKAFEQTDKDTRKYVILECKASVAKDLITSHVRDIYVERRNFHFFLTSLIMDDFWGSKIAEFGAVNVTGFRMLHRGSLYYRHFMKDWERMNATLWPGAGKRFISVRAALMYDGTKAILNAFERIYKRQPNLFQANFRRGAVYNNGSRGIDCAMKSGNSWEHGELIMNYLKSTEIEGLTGKLVFDAHGSRKNFSIEVVQTTVNSEMAKIAEWSAYGGLKLVPPNYRRVHQNNTDYENKTYVVTSILEEPFLMIRDSEDGVVYEGNDRFEGYCKDLADLITNHLKIRYTLKLVNDSKYGGRDSNAAQSWNGMVGELVRQEADMAIAPLTITSARERVIDFTKPFMNLGISIMIKKPKKKNPSIFSFMNPLSKEIWMCIVLSYFGVSVVMFLVSRFSPTECRFEETARGASVTNDFTLYNSLWFSLGAIMQQGVDVCPRSYAGRIVGSVWWFFTLIIISSYTANLAAFLTVERMVTPINSVDDLAKQTEVEYGVLRDSSTQEFFKKSKIAVYTRMWEFMNSRPHVFVDTYTEGIRRVRESKGKYAFLMESTQNDYNNERKPCDTMKVGRNLDAKGFGVATPLRSALRVPLNLAVLAFTENGDLTKLENKWWYDRSECKTTETKESSQSSLTLYNVAGCFYILIAGLVLAMFVAFLEFVWRAKQEAKRNKISLYESMSNSISAAIVGHTVVSTQRRLYSL